MESSGPGSPSDIDLNIQTPETAEPGQFTCPDCLKEFKSEMALQGHTRVHRLKAEPVQAPATSSAPPSGGDPEKEFLRGEIERLSLEVKRSRLTKEAEKYTPPEKKHDGPTAFSLTDLEMAELLEQKKLAVMDERQGKAQNVGPDPQLTAMQEKLDKLEAANEKLREDLRQKELDAIKKEIASLKEIINNRPTPKNSTELVIGEAAEVLKRAGGKADKLFDYLLMPSSPPANISNASAEVGRSAMEIELRKRGMLQ